MLTINENLADDFDVLEHDIAPMHMEDAKFLKLREEYRELDSKIQILETRKVPTTDEHFVEMKMRRVHLKDALYHIMQDWEEAEK